MRACCGFGHRDVLEKIDGAVYVAVLKVAEQGCEIFYTGAMGEFDSLFSSAVRKVKKTYPKIKLICIKPYFTNVKNGAGATCARSFSLTLPESATRVNIDYKFKR